MKSAEKSVNLVPYTGSISVRQFGVLRAELRKHSRRIARAVYHRSPASAQSVLSRLYFTMKSHSRPAVDGLLPENPAQSGFHSIYGPRIDFNFCENAHPWIQLCGHFKLRTGAVSGHPDQSVLLRSDSISNFISGAALLANRLGYSLRIYSPRGKFEADISSTDLLDPSIINKVSSALSSKPNFFLEMIGELADNFSLSVFVYDVSGSDFNVRSPSAFIRRGRLDSFNNIYPSIVDEFGKWGFGTPWPVDIVYTWVDSSDKGWQRLWESVHGESPPDRDRFSSRKELLYSLRSVAKYLPWYNKIYVVSNCQRPSWLVESPQVIWVSHEAIFNHPACLPTFNSHAIEACLHKIPGLQDRFIYFNDDMVLTSPVYYSDFYDEAGRSVSYLEEYGIVWEENNFDPEKQYLQPAINSDTLLRTEFPGYRSRQLHKHSPYALRRTVMEDLETMFPDAFSRTRQSRVRAQTDFNITSFFYHHYALATGRATKSTAPYKIVRPGNIRDLITEGPRNYKFLCFNDGDGSSNDSAYEFRFFEIVNRLFPSRSEFETNLPRWPRKRMSKSIMAYYPRASRVPYLRSMLGDALPSVDDGTLGLWKNAVQSWSMADQSCDYHMVIQDDALVASDFYARLEPYLEQDKALDVLCLFYRMKSKNTHADFNSAGLNSWDEGGFCFDRLQFAVAVVIRTELIRDMLHYGDNLSDKKYANVDDLRFSAFFKTRGIKTFYTLPSLVDHEGTIESTIREGGLGRVAAWFADGPNRLAAERNRRAAQENL